MDQLPDDMAQRIERVNRLARTRSSLPTKLQAVTELARRTVTNCDAAGIALVVESTTISAAASDRVVIEVDLVQYQTGEGPCLAAIDTGNVVRVDVVEASIRFPRFAPGSIDAGINSVLSLPLLAGGASVGAMNLYSRRPNGFDERTEASVRPLADYAAEVISRSPLYAYALDMLDGLTATLEEQALLAQAVGFVMAVTDCSESDAIDVIRSTALAEGRSMYDVSSWIVRERRTPTPRMDP